MTQNCYNKMNDERWKIAILTYLNRIYSSLLSIVCTFRLIFILIHYILSSPSLQKLPTEFWILFRLYRKLLLSLKPAGKLWGIRPKMLYRSEDILNHDINGGHAHKWSWSRSQDKTIRLLRPETSNLACRDHLGSILICLNKRTQKRPWRPGSQMVLK